MLQIKNTLGGGKPNAPYAWAKYEVIPDEILTNPSIDLSYVQSSGRINITGASFDLSFLPSVTNSNGLLLNGTDDEKQVVDFFTGFQIATNQYKLYLSNDVLMFYFEAGALPITEFHNDTDGTWFTVDVYGAYSSFEKTLPFTGEKIGRRSYRNFIEYITDKSPTKYPNGEVHTDGYFYRYAPEGLCAWKKNSIGSELKVFNKSVSTLPYNFYYGSAVVFNGEIHILGGYVSSVHTNHYKWDGSSWTSVSTLPYDFYCGSAVVLNNEIHILGGTGNSLVHYKFDGTTWTSVSRLPYNFYNGSAVVLNGEIHILGSGNSSYRQNHYKWNGTSWESFGSMPFSLYNGSAVVLNNEIHAFCGSGGSTLHYKWDGSSWTSVSTLPFNFTYGCAVIFENNIHVLGTYFGSNYKIHYKWDGTSWTSVSTLPYDFYRSSAVVYNNEIHILGSESSSYYTAHYSVYGHVPVYTFLDYVVSDKETAYPDGGEKGGYWYEKVSEFDVSALGITNFEIGSFTLTSGYSYNTVNHSLGILPKAAILFGDDRPKIMAEIFQDNGTGGILLIDDNGNIQSSAYDAKATTTTVKFHTISSSYAFKAGVKYRYAIFA